MPFQIPKTKAPFSTGSELLDQLIGATGSAPEAAMNLVGPLGLASGIITPNSQPWIRRMVGRISPQLLKQLEERKDILVHMNWMPELQGTLKGQVETGKVGTHIPATTSLITAQADPNLTHWNDLVILPKDLHALISPGATVGKVRNVIAHEASHAAVNKDLWEVFIAPATATYDDVQRTLKFGRRMAELLPEDMVGSLANRLFARAALTDPARLARNNYGIASEALAYVYQYGKHMDRVAALSKGKWMIKDLSPAGKEIYENYQKIAKPVIEWRVPLMDVLP